MSGLLDWPRYSRWTWVIAILLFLLLVVLWFIGRGPDSAASCCSGTPVVTTPAPVPAPLTPSPAQPEPVANMPGAVAFEVKDGKVVLDGVVPDQATKDRLLKAAIDTYGDGNVVDHLGIDATKTASACVDQVDALFAALKAGPVIGVACDGDHVTLTGTVGSDADKAAREQWAHDVFGSGVQVVNNIEVVVPPAPVAKAEDVRCGDKIAAAVTFATGSATIDAPGRKLLDAVGACLKDGNYEIAGYTDNVGGAEVNGPLSKARAESVRAYLARKGVAAERLTAVGHGADNPIADNATAEGRAKNRRIEFTKQ